MPYDKTVLPGSGFTAMSQQLSFGKLSEYSVSSTSSSIQATYSGKNMIIGVGFVIKKGPQGNGPPSTKYIDHYQVEQSEGNDQMDFPCGGAGVILLISSGGPYINSFTTSSGTPQTPFNSNYTGTAPAQVAYAYGVSCSSSFQLTPTWSYAPTNGNVEVDLVSIANANSTSEFFDTGHYTSGDQTTASNLAPTDAITPSEKGEIIFNQTSIYYHSETGTLADSYGHIPIGTFWLMTKNDNLVGQSCPVGTANSTLDEDNGWSYYVDTSDTNPITFGYVGTQTSGSCTSDPTGVENWGSASAAFR